MTRRCAALDLGSNSFHLLVADVRARGANGGRPWIDRVATRKLTLRLAEPVAATGRLGDEVIGRAVDAVGELVGRARDEGVDELVTVATSAIRDAADGDVLVDRLRGEHGVALQRLDGLGEGAASLVGMRAALHVADGDLVVGCDLGGGSYEVVCSAGGALLAGATLPLGVGRLSFAHDPPWLAERAALYHDARQQLADVADKMAAECGEVPGTVIGTAGTIRDLGRLGLALATGADPKNVRGLVVTREQLERACARLASAPVEERADLPGVSRKRADLLPAGAIVVLATLEALGAEQLRLCHWGVREGALLDALGDGLVVDPAGLRPLR